MYVCARCKKRYPETEKKKGAISGLDIFFVFGTFGAWFLVIIFKVFLNSITDMGNNNQMFMPCKYCGQRYF